MKTKLEEFIEQHREEFDSLRAGKDMWRMIERKLPEKNTGYIRLKSINFWLLQAAAVIVVALISIGIYSLVRSPDHRENLPVGKAVNPDVKEWIEAETFYKLRVTQMLKKVDKIPDSYKDLKENAYQEMDELDRFYVQLKNELGENIPNREILESMIQTYRLKLEILEDILAQYEKLESNENNYKNL